MPRIAWTTDLHLNFLNDTQLLNFLETLPAADMLLIGGDIGEAHAVRMYLEQLESAFQKPIYFVLGNHDYYRGSIQSVRQEIRELCRESRYLRWLPAETVIEITPQIALVGHDGWGDARLGDVRNMVMLNDDIMIRELVGGNLVTRLNELGDETAAHFNAVLPAALEKYRHVLVLTHVPPFKESCWHNGSTSGDIWLPRFTCHAAGSVLWQMAHGYPHRQLTVLCGHTHGDGEVHIRENLHVITGGAEYGEPRINRVFDFT